LAAEASLNDGFAQTHSLEVRMTTNWIDTAHAVVGIHRSPAVGGDASIRISGENAQLGPEHGIGFEASQCGLKVTVGVEGPLDAFCDTVIVPLLVIEQ
jgi:hypothetical protein